MNKRYELTKNREMGYDVRVNGVRVGSVFKAISGWTAVATNGRKAYDETRKDAVETMIDLARTPSHAVQRAQADAARAEILAEANAREAAAVAPVAGPEMMLRSAWIVATTMDGVRGAVGDRIYGSHEAAQAAAQQMAQRGMLGTFEAAPLASMIK